MHRALLAAQHKNVVARNIYVNANLMKFKIFIAQSGCMDMVFYHSVRNANVVV